MMIELRSAGDITGLIILGNNGVGKSFLANIILGEHHHFKHGFSAESLTNRTESVTCLLREKYFRVYNIPGLIEGDEERMNLNKREISRAFEEQKDNPLIITYVFRHQNGRIRNEDIVTFRAIHNAYGFSADSLITIINSLPPNRPDTYNEDTQTTLIHLLGMKPAQICFIDHLNTDHIHHKSVRQYLIDTIVNVHPRIIHTKTNNIDMINNMQREYDATERVSSRSKTTKRYFNRLKYLNLVLQHLFYQAKANLRRLIIFQEQEEKLSFIIEQQEAQEITYKDEPTSNFYKQAIQHKQDVQNQLMINLETKHNIHHALDICCKDIEQIYHGKFYRQCEHIREYFILFEDLCSDSTIDNVKHDFLNNLYIFTYLRNEN